MFPFGIYLLIKGADLLVDGASSVAARFGIPEIVIGLTIVAIGTSAPELFINLIASFEGETEIAIGNVLGSNMANTMLILGTAAIIYPITVGATSFKIEIPLSILALALTGALAHNLFWGGSALNLDKVDGICLLAIFLVFWAYTFYLSWRNKRSGQEAYPGEFLSVPKSILLILLGILGLYLGGDWVVKGAVKMAEAFNISKGLIAITIVAIGTSLPELVTSVVAARKKKSDLIIGNAIGSNLFNLLWVLGISAFIHPIPYSRSSDLDIFSNLGVSILLLICIFTGKRMMLQKPQGILFLIVYFLYISISIKLRHS